MNNRLTLNVNAFHMRSQILLIFIPRFFCIQTKTQLVGAQQSMLYYDKNQIESNQIETNHSLQMSHCSRSWTSWSDRTWYLCIWMLFDTLPHKSHTTFWSSPCICRTCFCMPFDRISFPHWVHGILTCLDLCFLNSSAVVNVCSQLFCWHLNVNSSECLSFWCRRNWRTDVIVDCFSFRLALDAYFDLALSLSIFISGNSSSSSLSSSS